MKKITDATTFRKANKEVHSIFVKRWSPRAMSGEKVNKEELEVILDAARWAPSSYNEQEWRYLYAESGSKEWETFFNLLVEGNKVWCDKASHLFCLVSKDTFTLDNSPNAVASLDCGASMQNFLLQTAELGLVGHAMGGFDWEAAKEKLEIPDGYSVQAMIALGRAGELSELPEELAKIEKPTSRKAIEEIATHGKFSFS